jgi:WD40 repeat protein
MSAYRIRTTMLIIVSSGVCSSAGARDIVTPSLAQPIIVSELGHSDAIHVAAYARHGAVAITVGKREVVAWDTATGREIRQFRGHENMVRALAVSSSGDTVMTGSSDGTARLWDLASGREIQRFVAHQHRPGDRNRGWVIAVAFERRSPEVITVDQDERAKTAPQQYVTIWDIRTGAPVSRFQLPPQYIDGAAFTPGGERVLILYRNGRVTLYDSKSGRKIIELEPEPSAVLTARTPVVVSSNGKWAARITTTTPGTLYVYDLSTGRVLWKTAPLPDYTDYISAAMFDPTGRHLLVTTLESHSEWNRARSLENRVATPRATTFDAATGIQESTRSLGSAKSTIRWKGEWGNTVSPPQSEVLSTEETGIGDDRVETVAFSEDGRRILFGLSGGTGEIVDATTGMVLAKLATERRPVEALAVSANSTWLAIASATTLMEWNLKAGRPSVHFGPLSISSSRAPGGTVGGPFVRAHFIGESSSLVVEDSDRILYAELGPHPINGMDRRTPLGYIVALRDDRQLALLDTGSSATSAAGKRARVIKLVSSLNPNDQSTDFLFERNDGDRHAIGSWPFGPAPAVFAQDGKSVFFVFDGVLGKLDVTTGAHSNINFSGPNASLDSFAFDDAGERVLTPSLFLAGSLGAGLWNLSLPRWPQALLPDSAEVTQVAFAIDNDTAITGNADGMLRRWTLSRCHTELVRDHAVGMCKPDWSRHVHTGFVTALAATNEYVFSGGEDGLVQISRIRDGALVATVANANSGWTVVAPDGRFDTNDLDRGARLHWRLPNDPFRVYPLESFMRYYFEPGLLAKVMSANRVRERQRPLRSLQSLNLAMPSLTAPLVHREPNGITATVRIVVSAGSHVSAKGDRQHSDAYNLRLFRNGALVDQVPLPKATTPGGLTDFEMATWRRDAKLTLASDARIKQTGRDLTVTFSGVKLPHFAETSSVVEFSAYAFNRDRVKTPTVRSVAETATEAPAKKVAHLVLIGVDDYGSADWKLEYAAKDARKMAAILAPLLRRAGYELDISMLVSATVPDPNEQAATKGNIRSVMEALAAKSSPDDLVVLFYSGHGYSGEHSEFFVLPSDSRPYDEPNWGKPAELTLARMISAQEIAGWLRKVDASELVVIIDACHAAAGVETPGFRPGPLGSRGLGQLAYDKRMRILAASQSDQAAREIGGQIGEGVLTYALLHDALQARKAANARGDVTLVNWLEYPIERVPHLFEELKRGKVDDYGVPVAKDAVPPRPHGGKIDDRGLQEPALFDYGNNEGVELVLQQGNQ